MQKISRTQLSNTKIVLNVIVDNETLKVAKNHSLEKLSKGLKIAGFRPGTAPLSVIEKSVDQNRLAEEFLNDSVQHSYSQALKDEGINPISPPQIEVLKFVPFSLVEYKAEIEVIGKIELCDYKKLKSKKLVVSPDKADIEQVLENMLTQMAEKKDVTRAAKSGDQTWINFEGKDSKGNEVKGAKGDNYPLLLGSNTFIPGFEDHIVGLKSGDDKEFTITFPKDYGVKALQSKKVTFKVKVVKVQEVVKPKLDDEFAKKVAPGISNLSELRKDISKQLEVEAENKAQRNYENSLVAEIVEKSEVELPQVLIDEQAENVLRELKQNIVYRGQTMEEYLDAIGMTAEEQHKKEILPEASRRLKAGILLSEIAEKEMINVSQDEVDARIAMLKARYSSDNEMQKQLSDKNNQRELGAQVLTEKTISKIIELNS